MHMLSNSKDKTKVDNLGRVCTNCKTYKKWEHFFPHKQKKYGYQEQCKACVMAKLKNGRGEVLRQNQRNYQREYKKKNPLRYKASCIRGALLRHCKKHQIDRETT